MTFRERNTKFEETMAKGSKKADTKAKEVKKEEPVQKVEPAVPPAFQVFQDEALVKRIFDAADATSVLRCQAVNSLHSRVLRKSITEIIASPPANSVRQPIPGWMSHLNSFPFLAVLNVDGECASGCEGWGNGGRG